MRRATNQCCYKGFSLIETLISLALGIILLACVFQVYLSSKNLASFITTDSRVQENFRFVSYFLRRNISMAGYAGCGSLNNVDIKNATTFSFAFTNSVQGFSSNNLPSYLQKYQIASNTDVLVIQKADEGITNIKDNEIKRGATSFTVEANPATPYNNFLFLSDCVNADLFVASNVGGNLVQAATPIKHDYKMFMGATQVGRFTETAYFISTSENATSVAHARAANDAANYGLFYAVNGGDKERLMGGIDAMQISYGVANNAQGKVSAYYSAAEVTNKKLWNKVRSIIITLQQTTASVQTKKWDIYIVLRERMQ